MGWGRGRGGWGGVGWGRKERVTDVEAHKEVREQ